MTKVVVGMSGGVDSSVAAALLKEQGYEVIGLFMHNWEEDDDNGVCTSVTDYEDVKRVCNKIGIPYFSVNFAKDYLDRVFKYFLEEYEKGRTPNPDVLCNREIKFGPFLEYAKSMGADYIATGHYAKVERKGGLTYLCKAKDAGKDQTYFLNQLNQNQLRDVLFPLGDMVKSDVRKLAEKYGLSTAEKKDSTGICFIGERRFRQFLKNYLPCKAGDIVDLTGKKVGEHEGVIYYTLGQRRGLNIGGKSDGNGNRWYVVDKNVKENKLIVSQGEGEELFSEGLVSYKINWIPKKPDMTEFDCFAKFRYRQPDQKVRVKIEGDGVRVYFAEKQRAVTPGQYVVFYDDTHCLGGGVIEEVF
ncbi:MAG: tRNA 2-thiouridine(34) synthase MnmA [Eubacteriales bacterium]|nr:tRNA 2-thiouridine(34) synthase MnmA [Eubacteriales bacterium]